MDSSLDQTIHPGFSPTGATQVATSAIEICPNLQESTKEGAFYILKQGVVRQRYVLSPEPILRLGADRELCDIALQDPAVSDIQITLVRCANSWILLDCGRSGTVRFNGLPCLQHVMSFAEICIMQAGDSLLLFTTQERQDTSRRFQALPLKYPLSPLSLNDPTLPAGACALLDSNDTESAPAASKGEVLLLGQHKLCNLRLSGDQMAQAHACLFWGEDGVFLTPLGSPYPTVLDGTVIAGNEPARLNDGQQLQLGPHTLTVSFSGDVAARAAALCQRRQAGPGFTFNPVIGGVGELFRTTPQMAPITLGRTDAAQVVIPDAAISRQHVVIQQEDRRVLVSDNNSSNGTVINGYLIKDDSCVAGDVMLLGESAFLLHYSPSI